MDPSVTANIFRVKPGSGNASITGRPGSTVSRRRVLAAGGLAAAGGAGLAGSAAARPAEPLAPDPAGTLALAEAPDSTGMPNPAGALDRLLTGNRRFVAGRARHPRQSPRHLRELADGQRPFAITLGCADSRVPPELLFDQGLGDLFEHRVAGNVVDDLLLGSIEFALEEFAPPLLLVRCGAVTATVAAIAHGGTPPGSIGSIVDALRPTIEPMLDAPGDVVEAGVRANVRMQVRRLTTTSAIVRERVRSGRLAVIGARYDLDHGLVSLLTPPPRR